MTERSAESIVLAPTMTDTRKSLLRATRVVVKIGSQALASDPELIDRIAGEVARLGAGRRQFVIVSSGAIALGCARLGYRRRPKEMGRLQAAAAAGQSVLMHRYESALARADRVAAQVLLTHADLADRERLNNAREALAALLEAGAVPIINENDTVSTDEIRFGDNDQLASMVVPLVGAEVLVLLTDVSGVLDERGERIRVLAPERVVARVEGAGGTGSGGIQSKVDAARKAARSGAAVVIASAREPDVLLRALDGKDVGTFVAPHASALRARQHWIAFTLRPRGTVVIDAGAAAALRAGRSSLLPVGVVGVRGQFSPGDAVLLVDPRGVEVARGLTRLGAMDVARSAGKKRADLGRLFGGAAADWLVVHKDDLVVAF